MLWFCLSRPGAAHPIDEYYLRYEVQVMLLTRGLRLDVFVLHGGLAAMSSWRARDLDQDLQLSEAEQAAWAQALANQVALTVNGRAASLTVELAEFPDHGAFTTCAAPIVLRAGVDAVPAAGRPIPCQVAVRPDPGYPVLARVSFVAPASVAMTAPEMAPGAAETTVTWPAGGDPDTRLPQLTAPTWFYEQPEELGLAPLPPSAPTDRSPVSWAPAARLQTRAPWPAGLLALAALAALVAVLQRRRLAMR